MKKLILIAYLVLITNNSFGHEYNVGNLLIDHPKIIKNENNAKGYMIITNKSESDLFLFGGRSSFSEELILHRESSFSLSNMQKISQIKILRYTSLEACKLLRTINKHTKEIGINFKLNLCKRMATPGRLELPTL